MPDSGKDNNDAMEAGEEAHKYFMNPKKPGVLLCIPVHDVDISGMFCYFAQFLPEDDDTGAWNVTFPDFPGCVTCGSSLKQAMANAIDALGGYLNVAKFQGLEIPKPSNMAAAIEKSHQLTRDAGIKSNSQPLYLFVPAWPDI